MTINHAHFQRVLEFDQGAAATEVKFGIVRVQRKRMFEALQRFSVAPQIAQCAATVVMTDVVMDGKRYGAIERVECFRGLVQCKISSAKIAPARRTVWTYCHCLLKIYRSGRVVFQLQQGCAEQVE